MKKFSISIFITTLVTLPALVLGQTFADLAGKLYYSLVPLLVNLFLTFAVLFFAWGVLKVIMTEGDQKAVAKERLLWATIALFVMMSFWGILRIVNATFFTNELGEGSYTPADIQKPSGISGKIDILVK